MHWRWWWFDASDDAVVRNLLNMSNTQLQPYTKTAHIYYGCFDQHLRIHNTPYILPSAHDFQSPPEQQLQAFIRSWLPRLWLMHMQKPPISTIHVGAAGVSLSCVKIKWLELARLKYWHACMYINSKVASRAPSPYRSTEQQPEMLHSWKSNMCTCWITTDNN